MRSRPRRLVLTLALAAVAPLVGAPASMQQAQPAPQKRAIELDDIITWKSIASPAVSNDGQWFAYRLAPGEGDAQIVVRSTRSDKEMTFDIGEPGRGGPAPAAGGAVAPPPPRSISPRTRNGCAHDVSNPRRGRAASTPAAAAAEWRDDRRPRHGGEARGSEDPPVCILG